MRQIYLDFNATTPVAPSVQEAMLPFFGEHFGDPAGGHALGRACQEAIEDARSRLADALGADPDEIVFTSGGTEAANLAVKGVLMGPDRPLGGHLVVSAVEHPAVAATAHALERLGCDVSIVACDAQGRVDPHQVEAALRPDTALVCLMHANHEIGTIQPIEQVARLCQARDVLLFTDAAQSVGKIVTRVDQLQVDLLALSGHKFYGPKGVGALYVRRGTALEPLLHGGGHEGGLRSGAENVPAIVALGKAAALTTKCVDESVERLGSLRDRLLDRLQAEIGPRLTFNGHPVERLPNTLSVNFPGVSAGELLLRVPELCASTGSAAHFGGKNASPTLAAIGLPPDVSRGTVRLSLGWSTSQEQIDRAASLLTAAWEDLH